MLMHPVVPPPPSPASELGGGPLKPVPFDMAQWRKAWGSWWSQANRAVITAAMQREG